MYPKIVLVVTRTHWRCLTCKELNTREVSIDQHLASIHQETAPRYVQTPRQHFDMCSHSDGELDTKYSQSDFLKKCNFLSVEIKRESSQNDTQTPDMSFAQKPSGSGSGLKKKSEKAPQKRAKLRKKAITELDVRSENDSDADYLPCEGDRSGNENTNNGKEKKSCNQRQSRRLKTKRYPQETKQALQKSMKGGKTAIAVKIPSRNQIKVASTPTKNTNSAPLNRKVTKQKPVKTQSRKGCKDSKPNSMEGDMLGRETETGTTSTSSSTANSFVKTSSDLREGSSSLETVKQQPVRRLRKSLAPDISLKIDKTNIATSCVPWLLDNGRKAGEKVTKKTRRSLPPEEKQAVRELYGVSLLPARQTNNAPGEGIQHFMTEHQQRDVGTIFSSHKPAHTVSAQRLPREKGVSMSDQNYVMSTGSASTGAFFMGPSHTQQTLYAEYSSAYPRQQQHDSHHYAHQLHEFYPSSISTPPQRSNMVNFQGYSNSPTQALSAGHHAESDGYRGQNQSMNRLPHPQSVSASSSSNPHIVLHAMQSSAEASLNSKTDHVSAPEADCKNILFDSNPDNQCRICEEKFLSAREYENHQKEVSRFDAVECKRCKCTFHGLHELNLHVFSQHETEKRGFCFTCDHDALGMEDLERHVHIHAYNCQRAPAAADLRFHDCQTCGEELLNSYTDVHVHYYQHHATHICSSCYQIFRDVQAYKDHHNQTHRGKAILCSICGSKFESLEDLDEHTPCSEDIWAEDGKGESCFKCGNWCPNRSVVEAHKKQHRSQEDVEAYREGAKVGFPCPSCEKVFKNKHACRRHAKMVHEGVSCYKHYCEYCGKGFLTKGHMRDHIALHHLKIKRYKCDYCDKQFVCGPTLRRHVRMEHTKYKPYQCPHCDERFFEKTPLQRHLTVHTGLAPFMCEHCGKGFYTRHSFRNHSSTHSTVKEFVCSGCQKGFTRKYNLLAHNKICKML